MTHTEGCITVASRAVHLFGLGDGHGFTTQQRTHTHVSKHTGRCGRTGPAARGGWGPHATSGWAWQAGPVAGDKAVDIAWGGRRQRAEQGPAAAWCMQTRLKHFLGTSRAINVKLWFPSLRRPRVLLPPYSLQGPLRPSGSSGGAVLGEVSLPPRAFLAHDPMACPAEGGPVR